MYPTDREKNHHQDCFASMIGDKVQWDQILFMKWCDSLSFLAELELGEDQCAVAYSFYTKCQIKVLSFFRLTSEKPPLMTVRLQQCDMIVPHIPLECAGCVLILDIHYISYYSGWHLTVCPGDLNPAELDVILQRRGFPQEVKWGQ